jgi:ribose/xylose/arabinose/galactoside ABC-type transport system permease subunit
MSSTAKNITAFVATLGVTALARKIVDAIWKAGSRGKEPPTDPADPDIALQEAIVFAILSGAAISVARLFIARRLAKSERREARVETATGQR